MSSIHPVAETPWAAGRTVSSKHRSLSLLWWVETNLSRIIKHEMVISYFLTSNEDRTRGNKLKRGL